MQKCTPAFTNNGKPYQAPKSNILPTLKALSEPPYVAVSSSTSGSQLVVDLSMIANVLLYRAKGRSGLSLEWTLLGTTTWTSIPSKLRPRGKQEPSSQSLDGPPPGKCGDFLKSERYKAHLISDHGVVLSHHI